MSMRLVPWLLLAAAISTGLGFAWGNSRGHARGVLETQASHDAHQVNDLGARINAITKEFTSNAAANRQVRETLVRLETRNRDSNQELKHELAKIPDRLQCHFDAGVMRIITTAADRADVLAAGGTGGALPASDQAERQQ